MEAIPILLGLQRLLVVILRTRREVTVDSNITSTSAADLRVEYEIGTPSAWFSSVTITTQQKIDGIEAGRYACREDIDYLGTRFGDGNYFNFKLRNNVTTSNGNIFCELPSDATAIAAISSSLALGATQSFNYISDSFAGGITTSSDEQFTPTLANGVSSGASSKTKLKGSNLHFGYAFENFRLTFSDFSWSSQVGTSALRCFLPIGCYYTIYFLLCSYSNRRKPRGGCSYLVFNAKICCRGGSNVRIHSDFSTSFNITTNSIQLSLNVLCNPSKIGIASTMLGF